MFRRATTRYWGVAIAFGLLLAAALTSAAALGRAIPARAFAQAAPPDAGGGTAAPQAPSTPVAPPPTPGSPPNPAALPGTTPASATPPAPAPPPPPPFTLAWASPVPENTPLHLLITESALVTGGTDAPLRAYDPADGHAIWASTVTSDTALAEDNGQVFGVAGGTLSSVVLSTGARGWSAPLGAQGEGAAAPMTLSGTVLVAHESTLRAFHSADGREVWHTDLDGPLTALAPWRDGAIVAGYAIRSTPPSKSPPAGGLAMIDLPTGRISWRASTDGVVASDLLVANDRIYASTQEAICAFRQTDGRFDWCFNVHVRPIGPAVLDDRYLYVAWADNIVRAFDRGNGAQRLTFPLDSRPASGAALVGPYLAVPLLNAEFTFFARKVTPPTPIFVSAADRGSAPIVEAAAIARDGKTLAMLTVTPGGNRTISVFRAK